MHSILAAEALSLAVLGEERLDTTHGLPKAVTLATAAEESTESEVEILPISKVIAKVYVAVDHAGTIPCVDYRCQSIGCGWIRKALPSTKSLGVDHSPDRCPGDGYHATLPTAVSLAI